MDTNSYNDKSSSALTASNASAPQFVFNLTEHYSWEDFLQWEGADSRDEQVHTYDAFLAYQRTRRVILAAILITQIILGILGNVLVIYSAVTKCRHVNSAFYVFLVNLCSASLILLGFEYPLLVYENVFHQPWQMGEFFCQLHGYVQYCAFYGVAYALVMVLVFRLLQITVPDVISTLNNTCMAAVVCGIQWGVILLANIPTWLGHGLYDEIEGSSFCYHKQLNENQTRLHSYLVIYFLFAFAFPVIIMLGISGVLVLTALKLPPGSQYGSFSGDHSIERNTTVMLVGLIVAFIVCWGPTNIFILLLGFDYLDFDDFVPLSIMSDVFMCFACANPCINPWIILMALHREFEPMWGRNRGGGDGGMMDNNNRLRRSGNNSVSNGYVEEAINADVFGTDVELNL